MWRICRWTNKPDSTAFIYDLLLSMQQNKAFLYQKSGKQKTIRGKFEQRSKRWLRIWARQKYVECTSIVESCTKLKMNSLRPPVRLLKTLTTTSDRQFKDSPPQLSLLIKDAELEKYTLHLDAYDPVLASLTDYCCICIYKYHLCMKKYLYCYNAATQYLHGCLNISNYYGTWKTSVFAAFYNEYQHTWIPCLMRSRCSTHA